MIGQPLTTSVVLGTTASNPIVGETPATSAAVVLTDNDYLTTGPLIHGQSGDMGGLGEFTAEGWFRLLGLPGSTIDLLRGPPGGGGAIQWRLQVNTSGNVVAIMRTGPAGGTTQTATTQAKLATNEGSAGGESPWYHLVATVTAGTLRIYINAVQLSDQAVSGDMPLIDANGEMRVGDAAMTGMDLVVGRVAVYRRGLDNLRVQAHYTAGRLRGYDTQLAGSRIASILDTIGSTVPRRLNAGVRLVGPVYMQGQSPLDEMRVSTAAEAVETRLFVAKDGTLVFLDSGHRSAAPYNTVQATFDDDGTDLPYGPDPAVDYSDAFLANYWNVTRTGTDAATQTVQDATSVSRYKKRSQSLSVPVTTDGDALAIANAMLAKYKDPMTRITTIQLSTANPDVAEAVLAADLGDRIRILRTPPGGGTRIDQTSFIQKIDEGGSNDGLPWQIRWGVSPL